MEVELKLEKKKRKICKYVNAEKKWIRRMKERDHAWVISVR
jgi:hypothetical protein